MALSRTGKPPAVGSWKPVGRAPSGTMFGADEAPKPTKAEFSETTKAAQRTFLLYYQRFSEVRAGTDEQQALIKAMIEDPEFTSYLDEMEQIIPQQNHWIYATIRICITRARMKENQVDLESYKDKPGFGMF